ncbi:hypothetical protein F5884DRAFT_755080 [Xylogone sp. PMI_703]|nr:hypothetical protein F5884DRAFT_755080 [Xylogone sp. PMI_703]
MKGPFSFSDLKKESIQYVPLPDDVESPDYGGKTDYPSCSLRPTPVVSKAKLILRFICAIVGYVISVVILWFLYKHWTRPNHSFTDCGTTPDEARAAGCSYEPMQRSWVPPECYFPEPGHEEIYDIFHNRIWYADLNLTIPADVDGLVSGDVLLAYLAKVFFITHYWHDEHCAYVLRKLAMAVAMRQGMVTSIVANIAHANHCAHFIANRVVHSYNSTWLEADHTFTESYLVFEKCVPLDVVAVGPGLSSKEASKWETEL